MNQIPQAGEIYQHFKGNLYRIVTLATHTETGEQLVIYQALYGEFQVFARPLSMFLEKVDADKYPEAAGKDRFTLIPLAGTAIAQTTAAEARPMVVDVPEAFAAGQFAAQPAAATQCSVTIQPGAGARQTAEHSAAPQPEAFASCEPVQSQDADEPQLDPGLLAFLEADSYEEKLEVFDSLAGRVDQHMLNTIAVSLDLELSEGSLEDQYDTLKNCLLTLERYECSRLR